MVAYKRNTTLNPEGSRLIIYTTNQSVVFRAPFAPRRVSYSGFEGVYNETARPDRKPILTRSGLSLRKISMELFVGAETWDDSVDDDLAVLESLAASPLPLIVEYDPRTAGKWRMSALSYDSDQREADMDVITRATAQVEFTEVVDPKTLVPSYIGMNRPKKYRPKEGESLRKIAMTYYGTDSKYVINAIAKANDITNIRNLPTSIRLP